MLVIQNWGICCKFVAVVVLMPMVVVFVVTNRSTTLVGFCTFISSIVVHSWAVTTDRQNYVAVNKLSNQPNMYKAKSTKSNILKIFHRNIQGLRNKCNEILCNFKEQTLHVLYFTEHHLEGNEIVHFNLDNYILGTYYSRKHFKKDRTCIYVRNSLKIATVNLDNLLL
jgi:hypothetical protein